MGFDSLPATKKRKLGPLQSYGSFNPLQQQPSFTEVLERLREEGAGGQAGGSSLSVLRSVADLKATQ